MGEVIFVDFKKPVWPKVRAEWFYESDGAEVFYGVDVGKLPHVFDMTQDPDILAFADMLNDAVEKLLFIAERKARYYEEINED
jgi:hypothetical protein